MRIGAYEVVHIRQWISSLSSAQSWTLSHILNAKIHLCSQYRAPSAVLGHAAANDNTVIIIIIIIIIMGGHVDVVASDVAEIIRLGAEIGLSTCHSTYPSASSLHTVTCNSMMLCFSHLAESALLPQPYSDRLCFKDQFSTTLGTSAVTISRELLTG